MKPIVYIVHHVDTEGPMYESTKATFERLKVILNYNIDLKPTQENLIKIQKGDWNAPQTIKDKAKVVTAPHLLNYKKTFSDVDEMLYRIMSDEYRNKLKDSFGGGWVFNWHIMDHVGYITNPRHRDMGYLNVFDHYQDMLEETDSINKDEVDWHFHQIHPSRQANLSATSYVNSAYELHQVICRRLIERNWFPRVNTAGMHTERPDSNWFLEQWIPFDASNQSIDNDDYVSNGRFGDWKGAPSDWSLYHPDIYDWRKKGNCNRTIARLLNLKTRFRNITTEEIEKAFSKAEKENSNVYLGVTNHDFREMSIEIEEFYDMLKEVSSQYPNVDFKFSKSVDAFRAVLGLQKPEEFIINLDISDIVMTVNVISGKLFGPQPYLAIKTKSGAYIHDNLDFSESENKFYYTFDENTFEKKDIDSLCVASNDKYGNQYIARIKF